MITVNKNFDIFIKDKLKTNNFFILNEKDDYSLNSFNNCLNIYNKFLQTDLLFDYYPKLWSFVFYKNDIERKKFLENIYQELGYDYSLNSFNYSKTYKIENNRVIITYNNGFIDYITLD